jgi:hypothetical protein
MNDIWLDEKDALYRVIAADAQSAARMLRAHLIKRQEIGKWSPVTVELVTSTANGRNVYREV